MATPAPALHADREQGVLADDHRLDARGLELQSGEIPEGVADGDREQAGEQEREAELRRARLADEAPTNAAQPETNTPNQQTTNNED